MSRRVLFIIGVLVVALVAAAVPLGLTYLHKKAQREQRIAATDFATAWVKGTLATVSFDNSSGADVAKAVATETSGLTSVQQDAPASVQVTGIDKGANGDVASAGLKVTWKLAGDRTWSYASTLPLKRASGTWLPSWSPSIVHPQLKTGGKLTATTQAAVRGDIIGANNQTLVAQRPVVVVGLQPSRATSIADSAAAIATITGVDGAALAKRAKAASKDAFVQAIVLRRDAYLAVRDQLQPIPGAVFQERNQALAPSADFARPILGSVGEATAEIVKASKGRVNTGDVTGVSGLQLSQDQLLAGSPGLTVQLVPASSGSASGSASTTEATAGSAAGTDATTLFSDKAVDGKDLHITLDEKIQLAAQSAILKSTKPAGIVVLRASTGDVLAVANGPANASGYNRALVGQYPPGSTFKIVSSLALLGAGYTTDTPVACPATINVGGRTFSNAENEVLGTVPFHHDFADSCNTAFVGSSTKITQKELAAAATSMGYGAKVDLGVAAYTGQVPSDGDAVAHAATMIGQGQVLASPLTVAGTAAAVDSGTYYPPRLVLNPDDANTGGANTGGANTGGANTGGASSDEDGTGAAGATAGAPFVAPEPTGGVELPKASITALRSMMREVVTDGTGTPLKGAQGGPVSGKTGTAEFGGGNPPKTHAWFTGFQGDIAFAVVVEDGGFGAESAAPIARDLLNLLA